MDSSKASEIVKRLSVLKTVRSPLESVWKDCYDACAPFRSHGLNGDQVDAQQGQTRKAEIMDGVTADAVRTLTSTIVSGLHPSNSLWFDMFVSSNQSNDESRWLRDVSENLFENIHASNFDAESFEAVGDTVMAGWFVLYIDEDKKRGGLVFQHWPIAQCYLSSTRFDGRIDTIIREYCLTASQVLSEFGDKASAKVKAMIAEGKGDEKVKLALRIQPRQKGGKGYLAKDMAFESCTVEVETKTLLKESGYHEFPCVCPRWTRVPDSFYAVGPLLDALPDARVLYELKRMNLANADLSVAGMWIAEDDGVLNPRTIKVGPRKIIVANSVDSMKPLAPAGNWQLAQEEIQQTQAAIRKILMADQLQPQDGPAMTATEVHVRQQLIRQLLGPVYGRFQSEYLQPLIERVFGLAYRAGVLTPPPETLAGKSFTVKYLSPLARAQKLEEATAIERWLAITGQMAQFDPQAVAMINTVEASKALATAYGVPTKVIRSDAEMQAIMEQKAQEQAEQQQQAAMQEAMVRAAPQAVSGMMQAQQGAA